MDGRKFAAWMLAITIGGVIMAALMLFLSSLIMLLTT
jgi:hypothetical protein